MQLSLLLETGDFTGRRYRLETSVCQNPVCDCQFVTLNCIPEKQEPSEPPSVRLEMDLALRTIANIKELAPPALSLARAIEAEISDAVWLHLRKIYNAAKQQETEEADLDQIVVQFPPEVMDGEAGMVGYYEIFPYAKPIEFTFGADAWIFDDQYCVKPKCSCREAVLTFLRTKEKGGPPDRLGPGDSPIEPSLSVRYDYDTGRIDVIPGTDTDGVSGEALLDALKNVEPVRQSGSDLNSLLAKRHAILRKLYKRALSLKTVRVPTSKPGRNDPCPCGSGKKHKKCCGA